MKFRIARTDGPRFTFGPERYEVALRPIGTRARSEQTTADWRIRVEKATFTFALLPEGIEITVEGTMPPRRVKIVVQEIAENIAAYTEQYGKVEELSEAPPEK